MSYLFALISGLIQGITEFLPVSSSGHLCLFQNVFGLENVKTSHFTFDILLHLATLAAVLILYRHDVGTLLRSFLSLCKGLVTGRLRKEPNDGERLVLFVLIATLPLAAAVLIADRVEVLYSHVKLIGAILILNAGMLLLSDFLSRRCRKTVETMSAKNALVIGLAQLFAVLPGLSRSGSTIAGGLSQGLKREEAVRFSFLLSIPAILGANVMEIPDLLRTPIPSADIPPIAVGMAAAFLSGIAAMKLLQYVARRSSFRPFAFYCAAVGLIAVLLG